MLFFELCRLIYKVYVSFKLWVVSWSSVVATVTMVSIFCCLHATKASSNNVIMHASHSTAQQ